MAVRTTATDVKTIMDSISTADAVVDEFIAVASGMTDEVAADGTLGDTRLEQIEQWLSAHLLASTIVRMGKQEKLGEASITYTGEFGSGLHSTPYGQMVKILDTTGILAAKGKKKITFKAITSFDS